MVEIASNTLKNSETSLSKLYNNLSFKSENWLLEFSILSFTWFTYKIQHFWQRRYNIPIIIDIIEELQKLGMATSFRAFSTTYASLNWNLRLRDNNFKKFNLVGKWRSSVFRLEINASFDELSAQKFESLSYAAPKDGKKWDIFRWFSITVLI